MIDNHKNELPILDDSQVEELFNARCADLKIIAKEKQYKKFVETCKEKCVNKKMNLTNMFLGPITASLIGRWMLAELIDITHLYLGENNLGDAGLESIAPAIAVSKTLIALDLQQNQFTPRCANSLL